MRSGRQENSSRWRNVTSSCLYETGEHRQTRLALTTGQTELTGAASLQLLGDILIFYLPNFCTLFLKKLCHLLVFKQWQSNLYKHFFELFEIIYFYHIFIGHISWNERRSFGVVFRLQRAQFNARPSL